MLIFVRTVPLALIKFRFIILLSSIVLQSFALGNDATQLPTGASDLVPDPRFEQYQLVSPTVKVAEWKIDFAEMDLEYEGEDLNVGSAISFQIIKDEMDVADRRVATRGSLPVING